MFKLPMKEKYTTVKITAIFIIASTDTDMICENPIPINLWCKWFLSGEKGDFPFIILIKETRKVSTIGIIRIPIDIAGAEGMLLSSMNFIASTEIIKPLTKDPVSPINMMALVKLYLRNPMTLPARQKATTAYGEFSI
jgi:hypothetical protein